MSSFENQRGLQQLCNNFSARVKKLDENCNELPGQTSTWNDKSKRDLIWWSRSFLVLCLPAKLWN
jgi:hypothetical protein